MNIKSLKDFFVDQERIVVEPIDHRNEKFFWCNKPYDFAKYKENCDVTMGESTLCFATSEGYFAGLNDGDTETYFNIEALEDDGAVAFVMGTMHTGIYGMFYEGKEFLKDLDMTGIFAHLMKLIKMRQNREYRIKMEVFPATMFLLCLIHLMIFV